MGSLGKKNKVLTGEPPQLWGGRKELKCSWSMLPAAYMAIKSRLWWWQWAMGVLFLEALTCRVPGTGGLQRMSPRRENSLPALTPCSIFWGLSEKFSRHTIRISTGCRRRCLRELLSKLLAACAAPDELAGERSEESPFGEPGLKQKV